MGQWQAVAGQIAVAGHTVGLVLFGGGLVYFVLTLWWLRATQGPAGRRLGAELFKTVSLAMSVGLTCLIAGGLLRYYLKNYSFVWSLETPYSQLHLIKIALFFVQWIAWGYFEIVTLHNIRLSLDPALSDESDMRLTASSRLEKALRLQLLLFAVIGLLGAGAAIKA